MRSHPNAWTALRVFAVLAMLAAGVLPAAAAQTVPTGGASHGAVAINEQPPVPDGPGAGSQGNLPGRFSFRDRAAKPALTLQGGAGKSAQALAMAALDGQKVQVAVYIDKPPLADVGKNMTPGQRAALLC